jgi:metal-responsive CopG/Arc/MetJ family transcriptional regulator
LGVHLRLHGPVLGAIDEAAKAEGVGRAEMIRRAIAEWLVRHGFLNRENGE